MAVIGDVFHTNQFTYDKENFTFYGNVSELQGKNPFSRLYDDAGDVGFQLLSGKTHKMLPFYHSNMIRDDDGDVMFWEFRCAVMGWSNLRVVIFND
jgi:hypothetical protein